ncbi:MAG: SGNH/GDSL hydrolase family protein [Deltaproteobacteria bacterium]|nr:SGNH/GDSL hydrolase family protein [Deltaproteobacteria bacterium]
MKKPLANAALFLASLAVGLALSEYLVRRHAAGRTRVNWHARMVPRPAPGLDFALASCPRCTPPINALGFRGAEVAPEKAPGVYRIVIAGDSATFGSEVPDEGGTVPGSLERLLNERSRGARFEVVNAGVPGYNIRQVYFNLVHKVLPLKPDFVIYSFFPNDLDNELYEAGTLNGHDTLVFKLYDGPEGVPLAFVPDAVHGWLNENSFLYKYATYLIHAARIGRAGRDAAGIMPHQTANLEFLDRMADLCRRHGAMFAVATETYSRCAQFMAPGDPIDLRHGPWVCDGARRAVDAVLARAAAAKIPAVDLQPAVAGLPYPEIVVDSRDHYTARGNRAMAEALYGFLAQRYGREPTR